MSTNTGVKPFCRIGATVVGKPATGVTIAMSVKPNSRFERSAATISRLAELPELVMTLCCCPTRAEKSFSNSRTFSPLVSHFPSSSVWIAS